MEFRPTPTVRRQTPILIAWLVMMLWSSAAAAWQVHAGYVRSDVGFTETRDGVALGVSEIVAGHDDQFDFGLGLDYVQKGGSYKRLFTDQVNGLYEGTAKVRLHVLEPSVNAGFKMPDMMVVPRLYVGLAYALKMKESWDNPDGSDDRVFSFENQDLVGQVGLTLSSDRLSLDLRYRRGFGTPLIDLGVPVSPSPLKASGQLETVDTSARTYSYQITLGWSF